LNEKYAHLRIGSTTCSCVFWPCSYAAGSLASLPQVRNMSSQSRSGHYDTSNSLCSVSTSRCSHAWCICWWMSYLAYGHTCHNMISSSHNLIHYVGPFGAASVHYCPARNNLFPLYHPADSRVYPPAVLFWVVRGHLTLDSDGNFCQSMMSHTLLHHFGHFGIYEEERQEHQQ
jgi:hypothetical protein